MTWEKLSGLRKLLPPKRRWAVIAAVAFALLSIGAFYAVALAGQVEPPLMIALSAEHESMDHYDDHVHPGNSSHAHERAVHLRVWDPQGALLFSTWRGEGGTMAELDPINVTGEPMPWGMSGNATHEAPMWAPLLPMLDHAPDNVTLRLVNYTFGVHALEEVELPKSLRLPRTGTLPFEDATKTFGNTTPGAKVWYLGVIPVEITDNSSGTVTYTLDITERIVAPVIRSSGLEIEVLPDGDFVEFRPMIPEDGFIAHNNCAVDTKVLPAGFYWVNREEADRYILARYLTRTDYVLEGATVDIEMAFIPSQGTVQQEGETS